MRRISLIFLLVAVLFSVQSCNIFPKKREIGKTLLLYINADNNLNSNAVSNIADVKKGEVPYYFSDRGSGDVLLIYSHLRTDDPVLFRVYKDKKKDIVIFDTLKRYGAQNSSSPEVFHNVLDEAYQLFPAKNNGLILWSHGSGWIPNGYYRKPSAFSTSADGKRLSSAQKRELPEYSPLVKSFGDSDGTEMEIIDLANSLPIRYSYIIFDACLMGGIEVAYQLKNSCDYLISSPAEILSDGFPYSDIMGKLFKAGDPDLKGVCEAFYNHYNQYSGWRRTATISLVNTSKLEPLAQCCSTIFASGRDNIATLDLSNIQRYYSIVPSNSRDMPEWFFDLDDFISNVSVNQADYDAFTAALSDVVEVKYNTPYYLQDGGGAQINKFSGLSVYIPKSENRYLNLHYLDLEWNKKVKMILEQ